MKQTVVLLTLIALAVASASSASFASPVKQAYSEDLSPEYGAGGDDDEPSKSMTLQPSASESERRSSIRPVENGPIHFTRRARGWVLRRVAQAHVLIVALMR